MSSRGRLIASAIRLATGAGLVSSAALGIAAPELPPVAKLAATTVIILTAWRPGAGLIATVALAPAGLLLARPPMRAAELLVWSFLGTWLICVWRPLTTAPQRDGALLPAILYALCAVGSWVGYTLARAPGVDWLMLPALLVRTIPADHVIFSSPEPETWTMLAALAGLGVFAAAAALTREHPSLRRAVAITLVASASVLALMTIADVLRQWNFVGYRWSYLLRYVYGERFSAHLADLNAAGSQYVLAGLVALSLATGEHGRRRRLSVCALAIILPALWLSGSRSAALGALVAGGGVVPWVRYRLRGGAGRAGVAAVVALGLIVGGSAVLAAQNAAGQGTVSNALLLRSQFLVTSVRMFSSAPIVGVGIGHYHERSNEFMPPALRDVYRHENAHNYFAQQFAELGMVGGVLFIWLVVAGLRRGWGAVQAADVPDAATLGLLAGCVGYGLTCVTGHPLLVPEAAMPFWAAFGALASAAHPRPASRGQRVTGVATIAVAIMIAANVTIQVRRYALAATPPGERGFYQLEKDSEGNPFVWMTRHGIFYVGRQPGTLTVPLQAPALPVLTTPFQVSIDVGGRRVGTYEVAASRWTTIQVPVRAAASTPFRRVDVRANQSWSRTKDLGLRSDDDPRSVMVGETRWEPAGSR